MSAAGERRARIAAVLAALCLASPAYALTVSGSYRSPRNPERKVRASTELIVLHTTEAPARSSLAKVSDRGECHYVVTEGGDIHAIVDRDREAFHAGRSMWNGREDVDKFSVGIECVGYHDKPMSSLQLNAIRDLVKELQRMYRIPDACVVCHSHVAYGAPNRWHPSKHRGRKRCGMLFAMPSVRARLGLVQRPASDADVRARRLIVGDPYLNGVLYGRTDTMRGRLEKVEPAAGGGFLSWMFGGSATASSGAKSKATPAPAAQTVASARPTVTTRPVAAARPAATARPATTAKPRRPVAAVPRSEAELRAGGWRCTGTIAKGRTALALAGNKWNLPTTYYTIRDKVIPGNRLDVSRQEKGMRVWVK